MAEIKTLEYKFSKDYHTVFQDMVTLIFCADLGLASGVNRRINQKAIESEPVAVGDRLYAYQAKYYAATTDLRSRKNAIIKCIQESRAKGITDLYLFINKELPDADSRTGAEASFIREIIAVAKGSAQEAEVRLDWWTLSRIESSLDMPKFKFIRDIYFSAADPGKVGYGGFYNYIYQLFVVDRGARLYGSLSLADSYIEPLATVDGQTLRVRDYLERLVEAEEPVILICGEPGHGKTSLCRKAMCDFYKNGWLAGKVSNVFCFSLNPARTNALANDDFDIYALLSWGDNRRAKGHRVEESDCENALIFLDAFDELLEWYPNLTLKSFLENEVIPLQVETGARIVLTTRTMALSDELTSLSLPGMPAVPVLRLQPLTKSQQIAWIRLNIEHYQTMDPHRADFLRGFLHTFEHEPLDENMQQLFGVPIIFRMIVSTGFISGESLSITAIYDELFHATWKRHRRKNSSEDGEQRLRRRLEDHALSIFLDDNETAEVDSVSRSAWVFSFYTSHGGRKRVGFLHRSFYQYFLAGEIITWYRDYAENKNEESFRERLVALSRRQLDRTTLAYIEEIMARETCDLSEAFSKSFSILKGTDGIIPLTEPNADSLQTLSPLERGNNCFWNILSIGTICGRYISREEIGGSGLRLYDLTGVVLSHAKLNSGDIHSARFHRADLQEADFGESLLEGGTFSQADLSKANFLRASLREAVFSQANLTKAILCHARLYRADFRQACLRRADLRNADLYRADLGWADLTGADLRSAHLYGVNLRGATLTNAKISGIRIDRSNAAYLVSLGFYKEAMTIEDDY